MIARFCINLVSKMSSQTPCPEYRSIPSHPCQPRCLILRSLKAARRNRSVVTSLIQRVDEKGGTTGRYNIGKDKLLYYLTDEYEPWRLYLPDIPYRKTIIHDSHDLATAGHPGFVQTYAKIAWLYYWANMSNIRKHSKECDDCRTNEIQHPETQRRTSTFAGLNLNILTNEALASAVQQPMKFLVCRNLGQLIESSDLLI